MWNANSITTEVKNNITVLHREIDWLQAVIDQVIRQYLLHDGHETSWKELPVPELAGVPGRYAECVEKWKLSTYERLALALVLAPHLRPQVLDIFFGKNVLHDRGFTEFGGLKGTAHSGFLPTGETALFLLAMMTLH